MELRFPRELDPHEFLSLGRNGYMYTQAIVLTELPASPGSLELMPVNTRNQTSRCSICIPLDRSYLLRLADALATIADKLPR